MSKGEKTRRLILETAAPIFNTKGIAGTAMTDIMAATNLSKGSMYVHFENKDELLEHVVDFNLDTMVQKISSSISKVASAKEKLMAYVKVFGSPMNPPIKGGCPMLNFGMDTDEGNNVIKERVKIAVKNNQYLLSEIITIGIANGEFIADLDAEGFATSIFAMIEGGQFICKMENSNRGMKIISETILKMIEANEQ